MHTGRSENSHDRMGKRALRDKFLRLVESYFHREGCNLLIVMWASFSPGSLKFWTWAVGRQIILAILILQSYDGISIEGPSPFSFSYYVYSGKYMEDLSLC